MTSHLQLVPNQPFDPLDAVREAHEQRAAWLETILVDRSRFKGSAGVDAIKKLRPLAHDEQACKDRCEEKVRAAKSTVTWRCLVWRAIAEKAGL